MTWILSHWGWLTGGGLIIVALVALAFFNLPAFLKLIHAVAGAIFKGATWLISCAADLVAWIYREFSKNAWRASCIAAGLVCIALTWQWQDAESELVVARNEVTAIAGTLSEQVRKGEDAVAAEVQRCKVERSTANTAAEKRVAEINAAAKRREDALKAEFKELDAKHKQEMKDAKATGDTIAAGIRSGTIQLRDEWTGQAGSSDSNRSGGIPVPDAAGHSTGIDDAAELRATSTGEAIEDAIRCDRTITTLQDALKAERVGESASK